MVALMPTIRTPDPDASSTMFAEVLRKIEGAPRVPVPVAVTQRYVHSAGEAVQMHGFRSVKRHVRRFRTFGVAAIAAVFVVQMAGLGTAFANAANPDPTTTGTATVNQDGTVTANLHGTWSWPGQPCAGRYGEGWAVDWWGISSTSTPNPSFSLTNASEATGPGTNTTGTISPAGAIPIPGGTFFHVAQFYAGQVVNSAATCTDSGTGPAATSSGAWSASATYPTLSDVPPSVCVNVYDPHGKEGQPSKNATDYSPVNDHDNSIQTNKFDPTAGQGFCVHLTVIQPQQKLVGHIYACPNSTPTTNEVTGGTLAATGPTTVPSHPNPLAKSVAAGTYTMSATSPSGFHLVACNGLPNSSTRTVTVPVGGTGTGIFYVAANTPPPTGYLEICKQESGTGLEHQLFKFVVQGRTVTVPVGACSPALKVNSGNVSITEKAQSGASLVGVSTIPASRLESVTLSSRTAVVKVVTGGVSTQTIATFTNKMVPGNGYLKVCKVAGSGVTVGTSFTFTAGSKTVAVPAGPAPGGYCVVAGQFAFGNVTVTEAAKTGVHVSSITAAPSGRLTSSDTSTRTAVVNVGSGVTDVTFTNTSG
jgi:hypothetical protein